MTARREGSDCPTGKVQWTREGAKEARFQAKRRGRCVRDYRCTQCGLYHLGHTRRADKRKGWWGGEGPHLPCQGLRPHCATEVVAEGLVGR